MSCFTFILREGWLYPRASRAKNCIAIKWFKWTVFVFERFLKFHATDDVEPNLTKNLETCARWS